MKNIITRIIIKENEADKYMRHVAMRNKVELASSRHCGFAVRCHCSSVAIHSLILASKGFVFIKNLEHKDGLANYHKETPGERHGRR